MTQQMAECPRLGHRSDECAFKTMHWPEKNITPPEGVNTRAYLLLQH